MYFVNRLFNPIENCEDAAIQICVKLNLKITRSTLKKEVTQHPDYPSLLSIKDVLTDNGIVNEAFNISVEDLKKIPYPFIAYIDGKPPGSKLFAPVYKISNETVDLYNPETKSEEKWTLNDFESCYIGTALIIEPSNKVLEIGYWEKAREEKWRAIKEAVIFYSLPVLVLLVCIYSAISNPTIALVAPITFTLLTLIGCIVSGMLLWHEIDQYNPTIRQICRGGRKINCDAVLNSKASRIWGVSWSAIGFFYFMGMLSVLLIKGIDHVPSLQILSWISIASVPFIFFSVFYQWLALRQWCLLCLIIQGVLLLQFFTVLFAGLYSSGTLIFTRLFVSELIGVGSCFVLILLSIAMLLPLLKRSKERNSMSTQIQRVKSDLLVFKTLLSKEKIVTLPPSDMGISLGNPNAKYKIVKVCNPYCSACAKDHSAIENFLESNEDVQIQIIFSTAANSEDRSYDVVRHLMAIAQQNDKQLTKTALNDWYLSSAKDYVSFSAIYPFADSLEEQDLKIRLMRSWCDDVNIKYTPTYFFNGYELPTIYGFNDLKFFVNTKF